MLFGEDSSLPFKAAWLAPAIPALLMLFLRAKEQYNMFLSVNDEGIKSIREKVVIVSSWDKIKRLEYKGLNIRTLTSHLVIHVPYDREVIVDSTFKNHKKAWEELVKQAELRNPNIIIDEDLKRKLRRKK